ncbi:hypothetical protein [Virgibacillus doumboii]|uniref:hypothetical protein n=1 Tax=Virgibacillus doumboii TaxID=2697503 RepID=UPI0013E03658|nr:hypothetical protein [Virgibacillus doumboii]
MDHFEQEIKRTKKKAKWGCLISIAILVALISAPVLWFFYSMTIKETTLVVSDSPGYTNTITVVEKGESAYFGPSEIRIKYENEHIDRTINNDGATLRPKNASVTWESETRATITLYGNDQTSEVVKFNAKDEEPFKTGQYDLGSFTFKTSESPNLVNIIELREVVKSAGPGPHATVKIYYGERGSVLKKFKEFDPKNTYTVDNFRINWKNDRQAVVEFVRENQNGEKTTVETIKIDIPE